MSSPSLHIISHSFPSLEAPFDATFVKDHAESLSRQMEVQVSIPTPRSFPFTNRYRKNHSPLILPENVHCERCYYFSLPKKRFPALIKSSLSRNMISFLKGLPIDLIHIHFLYPSGLIISDLKKRFNCPVVLTIHGVDFYHTHKEPGLKNILKYNLANADTIIAVGPRLKEDILKAYPHLADKVQCIHNFVDTQVFKPVKQKVKEQLRQELNIDPTGFHLLCVANFRQKKGIDSLIDALALIDSKDRPNLHLIGRINEESDFQASVQKKIESSGLKNVCIHGPKPRKEILKWMGTADGFVLPSRNEPFGISLIEAMACGLPVVSTRSGGPEIILNENFGTLVDPENPEQLAQAIREMTQLDSFDGEAQHKYIEEKFGKQRYTQEYADLYERLLAP